MGNWSFYLVATESCSSNAGVVAGIATAMCRRSILMCTGIIICSTQRSVKNG